MFTAEIMVNGKAVCSQAYFDFHRRRIATTIKKLREMGAKRIVEVGAHPWIMTAELIDEAAIDICATVSAEEIINWPDDFGVILNKYQIMTARGNAASVNNYSANIERTLFDIQESPDTVVACEIVEHLVRSPHIMFLNINRWLPLSGRLLVTTPNGAQFSNPFRRRSPTPAYRCNLYERHQYLYTLDDLTELITLCGFKILEAGYWDVYDRRGPSAIYGWLSSLPTRYFRDKFMKTIYLVGEKEKHVMELERTPRVYDPRGNWEFIRHSA
jgi:SAM-dependent methyltransferase